MGWLSLSINLILFAQQCVLNSQKVKYLPMLEGNSLLTDQSTNLPGATIINCGTAGKKSKEFIWLWTENPTRALSNTSFRKYPFTSHSLVQNIQNNKLLKLQALGSDSVGKFSFNKLTYSRGFQNFKYTYGLQLDGKGESAYWLPQGGATATYRGYIDIPRRPEAGQPRYVFTPDFSGGSWTVTPLTNETLRLRHVEGDQEDAQFNRLPKEQKGGDITYAMQFKDYGYIMTSTLINHGKAYAFMRYSEEERRNKEGGGAWKIHVQHKTCAPAPSTCTHIATKLDTMTMVYSEQHSYKDISGTEEFLIP